jgi:hypothetical protein
MSQKTISAEDDERTIRPSPARDLDLDHIRTAVKGMRHGEGHVIIQDVRVVQIDRVEQRRLR